MVNAQTYEKIRVQIARLKQVLEYLIFNGKSSYIQNGCILLNEEAISLYNDLKENQPVDFAEHILDWLEDNNWDLDYVDGDKLALVYLKQD